MTVLPAGIIEIDSGGGVARSVSEIPGVRVFTRIGGDRLLRFIALVFWLGILAWVPMLLRPDLVRPADIGSDTSNYLAAGERLVDGHSIYELEPDDRPVPKDNLPEWSGPLLSPPTVATTWAALSWIPAPILVHVMWAAGLAAATALGLYLIARLRVPLLLLSLIALYAFGVVAWSGNINALLAPALATVWLLSRRDWNPRAEILAGAIVGAATALKLGPAALIWWLITQRRWPAVAAALVSGAVLAGATLLLGGTRAFTEYVGLLGSAGASPSPLSLPGLASQMGLDPLVGYGAIAVLVGVVAVAMVALRDRPDMTFALAVLLSLVVVTIVRVETLVVGIAALVPWARRSAAAPIAGAGQGAAIAIVAFAVALAGVATSVVTGGVSTTSMALTNGSTEPVVVRLTVPGQYATFGYRLAPGQSGIAWQDELGSEQGRLVVFTADCVLLYDILVDHPRIGWTIGPQDATEMTTIYQGAFLDYDATCALELRARREGRP